MGNYSKKRCICENRYEHCKWNQKTENWIKKDEITKKKSRYTYNKNVKWKKKKQEKTKKKESWNLLIHDSLFDFWSLARLGPNGNHRFLIFFFEPDFSADDALIEKLLGEERDEHFLPQLVVLSHVPGNEVERVQAAVGVLLPHWRFFLSEHKVVWAVSQVRDGLQLSVEVREPFDGVEWRDLYESFLKRVFCGFTSKNVGLSLWK